jgi:shikimate dehydrogenase
MIHGYWLAEHGLAGSYDKVDVPPGELGAFLDSCPAQGFVGGNVTIPHKQEALRLVGRATDRARRLGAVNTLWYEGNVLHGDNTDVLGFVAHQAQTLGPDWTKGIRRALVLGAGGAARAIVAGLLDRGLGDIVIANRTPGRADALTSLDPKRVSTVAWDDVGSRLGSVQFLVNTTALGMTGHPQLQLNLSAMPKDAIVSDIVYVPLETALLAEARRHGLRTVDGLGMLLHQAVPGFAHWFGVVPAVTPELRALIVADLEKAK